MYALGLALMAHANSAPVLDVSAGVLTGSYDPVWWLAIVFGVLSALINLPIVEKPVPRMAAVPA